MSQAEEGATVVTPQQSTSGPTISIPSRKSGTAGGGKTSLTVAGKKQARKMGKDSLPKRHAHKKFCDNIMGITKPAIRRLARRGGVKRMNNLIYDETREVLRVWLEGIISDSITYCDSAQRKTVSTTDILYSLKRNGRFLYGYDAPRTLR